MAVWDWVTTAADNDDADSAINWAEGQAPSTVNDSARSMMARISHWLNTLSGNVTMGGASNAYTLTTGESLSAYPSNFRVLWQPNADSTGAVTLNVDAIGAKKVYMPDGTQAGSGDLDADSMYDVAYDGALDSASGGFKIIGFPDTTLTAADYLTAANNLSDLASASTARSNLGLGTMAVETASNYLTTATAASTYAALAGAAFTGSVTMAADLAVDTDTLFVDVSTDRVGIGTTSPATTLHVSGPIRTDGSVAGIQLSPRDGSGTTFQWYNPTGDDVRLYGASDILTATTAGNVGIGTTSPGDKLEVNGDVTAVDFNATSDARLKENVEALPYGLEAVLAMQPRAYDWIEQKEHDIGFIAQELEKVVPEVVSQKGEYKRVSYGKLVAVLAMAIQELTEEVRNGRS